MRDRTGWIAAAAVVTVAVVFGAVQCSNGAKSAAPVPSSRPAPSASPQAEVERQRQVLTRRAAAVNAELVALESLNSDPLLSAAGLESREKLEANLERLRKAIMLSDELHYLQGESARLSGDTAALRQRATRLGVDSRKHLANAAELVRQNWGQWRLVQGEVRFARPSDQQTFSDELARSAELAEQAQRAHAQADP